MIAWFKESLAQLRRRFLRLNLRQRIAAAMSGLVAIAAVLLVVLARFAGERLEENVNYDLLAEELTHYEQRLRADPAAPPLMSASLHIYRSINIAELPREIARLAPGIYHTVRHDGRALRVLVRDSEFGRLYITYDVTDHERAQNIALLILIMGVLAILLLTAWAALRISQPLLKPVHQLAWKLSRIDPRQRSVRLGGIFAGNELEPIARSIDSYLERLDGFVEREQAFTSTASHELRTPLAVIQGAVELLNEQYANQPSATKALARIQRAVREMSDFTAALLSLAREPDGEESTDAHCDVAIVLRRVLDEQQWLAPAKHIDAQIRMTTLPVNAPESMVAMVIGNIVRNALQHAVDQRVSVVLDDRQLVVVNQGKIAVRDLPHIFEARYTTRRDGHGMGLYLAQRICERYKWTLVIDSTPNGTTAALTFAHSLARADSPPLLTNSTTV